MTPTAFSSEVLAWVVSIGAVLSGIITVAASLYALYTAKFAKNLSDINSLRLNSHSGDIKTLMYNTMPSGAAVNITNVPLAIVPDAPPTDTPA